MKQEMMVGNTHLDLAPDR